ncbi:serine/threonine protein phosphatase [Pseudidiomarina marina]|uniref:serine/threonine protein phosphatase n=1 Tax=Pseudidiomarina marina TaxID=502366 RepID=UPI00384E9CB3
MQRVYLLVLALLSVLFLSACDEQQPVNKIPVAVADVPNIHHPNEQHFTAGKPAKDDLVKLKEQGVTAVINLLTDSDMNNDDQEAQWAQELELEYYRVPVGGPSDLTRDNVADFDRALAATQGQTTLIHCSSSNRVGAMMALHAAWYDNASTEQALQIGRDYGLKSLETEVQKLLSE